MGDWNIVLKRVVFFRWLCGLTFFSSIKSLSMSYISSLSPSTFFQTSQHNTNVSPLSYACKYPNWIIHKGRFSPSTLLGVFSFVFIYYSLSKCFCFVFVFFLFFFKEEEEEEVHLFDNSSFFLLFNVIYLFVLSLQGVILLDASIVILFLVCSHNFFPVLVCIFFSVTRKKYLVRLTNFNSTVSLILTPDTSSNNVPCYAIVKLSLHHH